MCDLAVSQIAHRWLVVGRYDSTDRRLIAKLSKILPANVKDNWDLRVITWCCKSELMDWRWTIVAEYSCLFALDKLAPASELQLLLCFGFCFTYTVTPWGISVAFDCRQNLFLQLKGR